jgi:hypothetical protein
LVRRNLGVERMICGAVKDLFSVEPSNKLFRLGLV